MLPFLSCFIVVQVQLSAFNAHRVFYFLYGGADLSFILLQLTFCFVTSFSNVFGNSNDFIEKISAL